MQVYTHFSWALGPIMTEVTYGKVKASDDTLGTQEENQETDAAQEEREQAA